MEAITPTATVAPTSGAVQLPDLGMNVYRSLVAELQALRPANAERIARALNVLLGSAIFETSRTGEYLIASCQKREVLYRTTGLSCTCVDRQRNPEQQCKHNIAVELLGSASGLASWKRRQAGEPNPPPPAPTASVCGSCGQEAALDEHGWCDLCGWEDAITVFTLTPAGMAYLDRCDARVAVGV